MSATQDYVALEWIRGELANTLQNAQVALEAVAESPDDASSMRSCLSAIHQVHGTLKMVQLEGPTQVAAEMEQLAQSLMNNSVPELQLAQENLMQAILQLPAYLDRLHREQEDSERNYLPMVNNLRSARGEERLPGSGNDLEADVSGPDISPLTTPPADAVVNTFYQADGEGNLPKIRARYQQSLGAILKKSDIRTNLTTIGKLFTMLIRLCGKSPMGRLSELGLAVVEGIANGGIRLDKTSAGLLKKVDGALKQLADAGQAGLTKPIDEDLANGLIGLIHGAQKETKRIKALRALYAFETTNVQEQVSIGPDDETMSAVAKILIEEIREVTDKLDLYVRSQDRNVDDLVTLLPNLEQISSTMVVLGSSDQQVTVAEQIDVIKAMGLDDKPDEETLLSMAQSLLQIEASLSALVIDSDDGSRTDDFASLDEAQAAVVRETRRSLASDKDAIIEFISADFDQDKLIGLPDSLRALRGGLMIVNQTRAGDVLDSAANYVTNVILVGSVKPELEQMDDLADAITSVDYYLERLLENAGDPYLQMLEVAETAVAKLGFAVGEEVTPIAAPEEQADEPLDELSEVPAEDLIEEDLEEPAPLVEVEEAVESEIELELVPESEPELEPFVAVEVAEQITEEPAAAVETIPEAIPEAIPETIPETKEPAAEDDLIDDEILEIFAEEAEEVLQTIGEFLPLWQNNPADEESLAEIRRAFHTLKGSGRMVGATVVGELGWSVENLLNRITDKTVEPSQAAMDIVAEVVTRIPEGVEAFIRGEQDEFKPQALEDIANALAEGREPTAVEAAAETIVESEPVEHLDDELIEVEEPSAEFDVESLTLEEPAAEPELTLESEPDREHATEEMPAVEAVTFESAEDDFEEMEFETVEAPASFELEDLDTRTSTGADTESTPVVDEEAISFELEEVEEITEEPVTLEPIEEPVTDEAEDSFELDAVDEIEFESAEELPVQEENVAVEDSNIENSEVEESEVEESEVEDSDIEENVFELEEVDELEDISFETVEVPGTVESTIEEPAINELDIDDLTTEDESFNLEVLADDVESELDLDALSAAIDEQAEETELEIDLEEASFEEDVTFEGLLVEDEAANDEVSEESIEEEILEEEIAEEESFALDVVEDIVEIAAVDSVIDLIEESPVSELSTAEELLESDDLGLDQIFTIEANEKLEVIANFVDQGGEVSGDVVAAFHTLKGSSAMAEIDAIALVAAPLEHLANDYLIQNKPADSYLIEAASEAALIIQRVLGDLSAYRSEVPGGSEFIARLASGSIGQSAEVNFDFQEIILLSEANIAADGWQDVEALIAEMKQADEQAVSLNQPALSALLHSMQRVYTQSPGKPDDLTLSLMKRAHDHLVFMFDALASSQPLRPADRVIADLDAVVIAPADSLVAQEVPAAEVESIDQTTPSAEVLNEAMPAVRTEPSVTELPADSIDEDILPIFLEESEELLEEVDQSILGWSESGESGKHLDNLLRQLHTIKGGARMAGASSLGEFAHNFETYLIGVQSKPVPFDDDFFALLNGQQDEITRRIEIYQKIGTGDVTQEELDSLRTAAIPGATQIAAPAPETTNDAEESSVLPTTVSAGADTVVDLPADEVDDDILPIFLEESDDLVEELESGIQSWSESPGDLKTLDLLLRNLHTLKGGARMAGLNSLGEYAHNFETFLIGIQKTPVELNDDFFALLNKRQDEVIRRVEIYKKLSFGAATPEDLESLRQALEPTLETEPVEAPEATEEAQSLPVAQSAAQSVAQSAAQPADKAASSNQEMVRVSADLLEELIGLAGESSITRGRIEQQITDFGESLQEMEDTIVRIRDQVRRLEIEAESRETLIRSRQGSDGESAFDELEMDRYTMLQAISRALSEGSSDMMDLKDTLGNRSRDAETLLHQQARISGELQEGLTRTRMVPFARLIPRLRRIVRQISGEVGKSVRFDAYNVEGELDRNVLERIVAPLEHMLRNAVDHGIENTEDRIAVGKVEQGRISLRLSREGGYVVLTISDDGGGINVEAVRAKATERGLITEAQEVTDHEVMQFIMHAGFSTAQKLTQISGRGVGMDVVGSEIKSLGGSISIDSTLGVGTEFTIRIPFTVSINRALMVVVKEETYAVPLNTIEGIVRVSPYELEAYYQPDAPMFEYAGQPYRLAYIGKMLDRSEDPNLAGQVAPLPVILARSGDNAVALQVDRVIGSREVVVKTLGPQFGDVGGISGATVLGDGSVVIILDCMALVQSYEAASESADAIVDAPTVEPVDKVRTVLIVDDSVTVRKVTTRIMERQGYKVATAKDGIDALSQLQDFRPDVMLLDIEMPRMDGFEVLRSVRRDDAIKDLPIIMITSRTGEKHKQQAMELGVNQYLGKPFQEASLLATIDEVIAVAAAKTEQG